MARRTTTRQTSVRRTDPVKAGASESVDIADSEFQEAAVQSARSLSEAIVRIWGAASEVPDPLPVIVDPSAGSGAFLTLAYQHVAREKPVRTRPMDVDLYVQAILDRVQTPLLIQIKALADAGRPLPAPEDFAKWLSAALPADTATLDPYFEPLGPFYGSSGVMVQLGGVSRQAIDSRRSHQTILAMKAGDGTWLYPAWQFTGTGSIHAELVPVLKALRGMERWSAGIWLVSSHPNLDGRSPRGALADGVDPDDVARLARNDQAQFAA
jgi:hypothetical protein